MATNAPTTRGVFTRASSGLVRQVRTSDVLYFGFTTIALSYIVFTIASWSAYPGASMELATLIAIAGAVGIGASYALFAAMYPRSGGEYVFLSRTLHPLVGFALSFSFAFWQMFYYGLNGAFFSQFALSPTLAAIGVQLGNASLVDAANWFGSGVGTFAGGAFLIALMSFLHWRGAGTYFRWQRWAAWMAITSIGLTILVLLLSAVNVLNFKSNFDGLAGAGGYDGVLAAGTEAGVLPAAPFDLTQTLYFVLWPAFSIWFAITATSFSGEVRNVQRGMLVGIVGSQILTGVVFIVMMFLYRTAFGNDFLLAAGAVGTSMDAPPFVPFFTAIAGGNVLLSVLMSLWVVLIALFVGGTVVPYATRALLAWGIDRVAPSALAEVNDRYHSPHWAIAVTTVVGLVILGLYCFTDLLGIVSGFFAFAVSFAVVCLWAVVFPYVRREQFENSPIAKRWGGIPVLTLAGVLGSAFSLFGAWRLTEDPVFTIDRGFAVVAAFAVIAIGAAWYVVATAYRRSQGVDLGTRFREIPVE
ncbi:MAG: APC family permease [Chloroflexi bacterium]|nr:APC family permease [Chloroflexota bacterium]